MKNTLDLCRAAKAACAQIASLTSEEKNQALSAMAAQIEAQIPQILSANAEDVAAARGSISEVMLDRLTLTESRVHAMADGIRALIPLEDPAGFVEDVIERPNGLRIEKTRFPLGVIAIIYESRPNVTSDAAALCFKSGNACVLRGGKESYRSSAAIVQAIRDALEQQGMTPDAVSLVSDLTHESAYELMTATGLVDLLIPRGGAGLIKRCVESAKVPCIQTGSGICTIFVDESADLEQAVRIIVNAKTQRPSVCNAEEVLLVHEAVAPIFLPMIKEALVDDRLRKGLVPVELRLDPVAAAFIDGTEAGPEDFDTEFLDYILAVKVVGSTEEAIRHIALHSTGHSEAILTRDDAHAQQFIRQVDSAAVYVNASTRFTDGGEFGLGCEMGISTQKLHARGPMGLKELTTYKYVVRGNGQIRE